MLRKQILCIALVVLAILSVCHSRVGEEERVRLWYERNNTWPPKWNPNESPQLQYTMSVRDRALQFIPGANERWENYMQYTQSRLVPRFTEFGFKVISTPAFVQEKLKRKVDEGLANWDKLRLEKQIDAVYTPLPSKFVDMHGLDWEVINDLKALHEEWVGGMKLKATSAYGTRLYQNGSSLVMHHDKVSLKEGISLTHCAVGSQLALRLQYCIMNRQPYLHIFTETLFLNFLQTHTHVISSIVHIAHEYDDDSEPWPI